jgi:hypothetical protein
MVLGIKIEEQKPIDKMPSSFLQMFTLSIQEYKKGDLFFSSPWIRKAIQQNQTTNKQFIGIGTIGFRIYPEIKRIESVSYNPKGAGNMKVFKKMGFAAIAELMVYTHLIKKYPDYKISSTMMPQHPRRKQLEKHGRKAGEVIKLKKAIRLLQIYVKREGKAKAKKERIWKRFNPKTGRMPK